MGRALCLRLGMLRAVGIRIAAFAVVVACQRGDRGNGQVVANTDGAAPGASGAAGDGQVDAEPGSSASGAVSPPAGTSSSGAPIAPMTVTQETLVVGGLVRSFTLAAPSTYDVARRYALVLVLHGDGDDGPSMRAVWPFDDVSSQDAFVAYPSGLDRGWDLYTPASQNADFAFLVALVDSLQSRFTVDPARVFGTGFSSGAFMVNQVACRRESLFRAIAPHSGGAPEEPNDPSASLWDGDGGFTRCAGEQLAAGPAALIVHGTADGTVGYESGDYTAKYWAYVNGCGATTHVDGEATCVSYDGCPTPRPVQFCSVPNLGHALWPDAKSHIWAFFNAQ
jgi:polyhydroxybutyrate depolymerase